MQELQQKSTTKSVFAIKTLISCSTLCLLLLLPHAVHAWMPDVRPDLQPKQDKIIAKFLGNSTDYFKILAYDDVTILVGAKDMMYNISMDGLHELSRLEWFSSDADRELCALKGKCETDCHNYIRVFARLDGGQILLCGTNSYKPRCRHYAPATSELSAAGGSGQRYEIVRDVEAQGLCPYSPAHNSTYAYADGQLYSATVADFSGSDPLIYRENLRTEQYDLKQLNQPDFVGAVERDRYVMFFFREISMEYMNFGKTIYSRVARVCKNDRGGPYSLSKSWTSFLKARLNCSVPGEFPFYFDEIQSITPIVESGSNSLIYAVFTTSVNAIPGSAVCAFNVNDIMDAFEGSFKSQKDSQSQWLPIQDEQVPESRPGKCVEDSRMLSSIAVNFAKTHPLMETAVPAVYGRPLLTKVNLHHRLTTIAIDAQLMALNGEYYDVIYSGTDDGRITKFINIPTPIQASGSTGVGKLKTVLISEMQVLPLGVPVRELVVSSKTNRLLVVSDGSLVTVPLHHCGHIVDCLGCLSLQDPNCAWDQQNHECKSITPNNIKFGTKAFLQSLNTTKKAAASLCPKYTRGTLMADGPIVSSGIVASPGIDLVTAQQQPQVDEELHSKKFHYTKVSAVKSVPVGASKASAESGVSAVDEVPSDKVTDLDASTGAGNDYLLNSFSDGNKITLQSVDPNELMNTLSGPFLSQDDRKDRQLKVAGKSLCWALSFIAFVVGVIVGYYTSKRLCKATSLHANHRNQFTSNSQFTVKHHNNGKDVNLLMNPNHFSSLKKPNLDLEKDRSHECKNSTENLEKEIPCKTSTLTKVKRTYI
ncbi:PREDICTED: semaphorin-1A [Bactrocera latifrons]|uniref:Semaphorin-1A n=1 Tax=Bactrocera latifrons TaxID=174628 RepID=A0A0K8WM15_BACLA|nr:PREDICTED: semaphorin-1A [Bactrocera latifrons]XP_018788298.1 PREDICTED: semaphorin-1A [Bactrocera latifrons]